MLYRILIIYFYIIILNKFIFSDDSNDETNFTELMNLYKYFESLIHIHVFNYWMFV